MEQCRYKLIMSRRQREIEKYWLKGRDMDRGKDVTEKTPYPANTVIGPTELNKELLPALGKFPVMKDRHIRLVQALIARATLTVGRVADMAM